MEVGSHLQIKHLIDQQKKYFRKNWNIPKNVRGLSRNSPTHKYSTFKLLFFYGKTILIYKKMIMYNTKLMGEN